MDNIAINIRLIALAFFKVATGGPHEKIPRPQRTQIHAHAPLHIDEQGALALLLQHAYGFGTFQTEVFELAFKIGFVRLRAP